MTFLPKNEAKLRLDAIGRSWGMIEFKLDGTIVAANENFLRVMGYRLEEIKGKHHSLFVEPSFRQSSAYDEFWRELNRGKAFSDRIKRIAKSGQEVWLEATYTPILDANGHPIGVIKLAADITSKYQLELDNRGKLEAIDRSQAVIEFDMTGKVITANKNFLDLLGYRLEEIVGQNHSMFVDPAEREGVPYRQFWDNLRNGQFQMAQYKRIGKGGREAWIEASYNPIVDDKGKPIKVIKFAIDISSRKEQNRQLALDFEQNVQKRSARLRTPQFRCVTRRRVWRPRQSRPASRPVLSRQPPKS